MSRGGLVDTGLVNTVLGFGHLGQQNAQFAAQLAVRKRLEEQQLANEVSRIAQEQQRIDLANQAFQQGQTNQANRKTAITSLAGGLGKLPGNMDPNQVSDLPDSLVDNVVGPGMQQQVQSDKLQRILDGIRSDSRLAASPRNRKAAESQAVWTYGLGLPGAAPQDVDTDSLVGLRESLGTNSPEWKMFQERSALMGQPDWHFADQALATKQTKAKDMATLTGLVQSVPSWPDSPFKQQALQMISAGAATPQLLMELATKNSELVGRTKPPTALDPDALKGGGNAIVIGAQDAKGNPDQRWTSLFQMANGYPPSNPPGTRAGRFLGFTDRPDDQAAIAKAKALGAMMGLRIVDPSDPMTATSPAGGASGAAPQQPTMLPIDQKERAKALIEEAHRKGITDPAAVKAYVLSGGKQ